MSNLLGNDKTIPAFNISLEKALGDISENATEILCLVAEELSKDTSEEKVPRGIKIRHTSFKNSSFDCFETEDLKELIDYKIVTAINFDGYSMVHCNKDVFELCLLNGDLFLEELEEENVFTY